MNLKEAFIIALRGLRVNKLRSALTTVGIVIGVTAVIVLVGLGDGMKAGFNKTFGELATAIIVNKIEGSVPGGGKARDLKNADVTALRDKNRAPAIRAVIPQVSGQHIATRGDVQFRTSVVGSTPEYLSVNNREIILGSMFTEDHDKAAAKVVLLGPNPVANLYGGRAGDAIGSTLRIGRANFKVIGVVKSDGHDDDIALMPMTTARANLVGGGDTINGMAIKATSVAAVPDAVKQITEVLSERHNISDPSKRDFHVEALQGQLEEITQFLFFLSLFIVAVAGISLIVGGIGVANIMLVSVTERTREIGIRKAIGAPRLAIMKQFLIESTVLAGIGGLIGVTLGIAITLTAAAIIPKLSEDFGVPEVSAPAIVVAFTVSLCIGLMAGGYPALRAAKLQPIEALRYQ
ncbi:ABC transporter permease [Pseudonocardia acaciae]|uniref:ABC transporter permease n=1 Tax=Pseudonocardia acaciae TaxID=551276 RepID=UPI00048AE520|nr:ABC transporter permease [Pseudonocardia acaciae]